MKTAAALGIIEDVFEIALNPTISYLGQLEPLAANGELSNRNSLNAVLFKLCELVDSQGKEIDRLKSQLNNSAAAKNPSSDAKITDPTKPLPDSSF